MMNGKKFIEGQSTIGGNTGERTKKRYQIRKAWLTEEEYCMVRYLEEYAKAYKNKEVA